MLGVSELALEVLPNSENFLATTKVRHRSEASPENIDLRGHFDFQDVNWIITTPPTTEALMLKDMKFYKIGDLPEKHVAIWFNHRTINERFKQESKEPFCHGSPVFKESFPRFTMVGEVVAL